MESMARVVTDGHITSVHDTPYTFLLPQLLETSNEYYERTVILLSKRDPEAYAQRRLGHSYGANDPICIDRSKIDPVTLSGGAFDVIGCIDRALSKLSSDEQETVDMTSILTSFRKLDLQLIAANASKQGVDIIAEELKAYQDAVGRVADFSYDMFAQTNRMSPEGMATMLRHAVPTLSGNEPQQLVNWWRMSLMDELPKRNVR